MTARNLYLIVSEPNRYQWQAVRGSLLAVYTAVRNPGENFWRLYIFLPNRAGETEPGTLLAKGTFPVLCRELGIAVPVSYLNRENTEP